jgi:lipopolysaccharide export system protein LptC
MMDIRSVHRLRLALALILTAALALGSFWLLEVVRKSGGQEQPDIDKSEPDYYVENFQFVRISKTDVQSQYSISGQRMTHYPEDDSHKVEAPVVRSLSQNRPPMFASSKTAIVDRINGKIHMYDDVYIDRSANAENERLQLRSEYLQFLMDEDIMQTDKPVVITSGQSILKGTGMVANNATGEFKLSGNVHVTYQEPRQGSAN